MEIIIKSLGIYKEAFQEINKSLRHILRYLLHLLTYLLLTFVYLTGVAVTSIPAKLLGKRLLENPKTGSTYWADINIPAQPIEDYCRMF